MSRLLRECRSVKVKRLFLWFADRHRHAWFDRLARLNQELKSRGDAILADQEEDKSGSDA